MVTRESFVSDDEVDVEAEEVGEDTEEEAVEDAEEEVVV
jgi:hypothetical protein